MSEEMELGRYRFFPAELETGKKTPKEVSEELKNLLEKLRTNDGVFHGNAGKAKKRLTQQIYRKSIKY
jgi:hypothetical protein